MGRTEEKTNQMMGNIGDKAQTAKEKAQQTAQAAKEKTQETAQAAKDKTQQTAQATKEKAQDTTAQARQTDNSPGFLQTTGEKVKGVAQGATEAVKNTLGLGNDDQQKDTFPTNRR